MGINPTDFVCSIIRPTLKKLKGWSKPTEQLLLGTAIHSSNLGDILSNSNEPASPSPRFGIYQISSYQHRQVWDTYLYKHIELTGLVRGIAGQRSFLESPDQELISNLAYSTAIAWLIYKQSNSALLDQKDANLYDIALCWHQYFTEGDATKRPEEFIDLYHSKLSSETL